MTAKEMFEELGYDLYSVEPIIQYLKRNKDKDIKITFGTDKKYCKFLIYENSNYNPSDLDEMFDTFSISSDKFTKQEIKAIQKQIEELGWEE